MGKTFTGTEERDAKNVITMETSPPPSTRELSPPIEHETASVQTGSSLCGSGMNCSCFASRLCFRGQELQDRISHLHRASHSLASSKDKAQPQGTPSPDSVQNPIWSS